MTLLWKAEIDSSMVAHLTDEQKRKLFNSLSETLERIAAEVQVGREFKHESK
jgi:hypothetical protein